ncbi:hypothetical protein SDC9_95853 [bioreactor metagenome]|uniref:Xylose isomerase-like TIM barrel domain-containing protein n=1 Tax=bioreactor metagenome TaxID=1076179 RepID=A0A645A7G2_9ZZZZ|nr:TIM barrel protein [Oscillospiraceae bacterium]
MNSFKISAFADEITTDFAGQIETLKSLGISYIEPRGIDGENISVISMEKARSAAAMLDKAGIGVSSIGSPCGKQNITEDFKPHFEMFRGICEKAKIFGTKNIRIFSFYVHKGEEDKYRSEILARMEKMLEHAEKNSLTLCHENETGIYGESPKRCLDIMTHFSGRMKTVFDPCNFIVEKHESYPKAFNMLREYIEYMHIKDADAEGRICPAAMGVGGIPEILTQLKADGKDGIFLTLEPHLLSFEGLNQLSINYEDLTRKYTYSSPLAAFTAAAEALRKII